MLDKILEQLAKTIKADLHTFNEKGLKSVNLARAQKMLGLTDAQFAKDCKEL